MKKTEEQANKTKCIVKLKKDFHINKSIFMWDVRKKRHPHNRLPAMLRILKARVEGYVDYGGNHVEENLLI